MFEKVCEGIKMLAQQMVDHPEDWVQGPYHYSNTKSRDINIWTANGDNCIAFEGNKCLNRAEQKYLANAIKKSIAKRAIIHSITQSAPEKTNIPRSGGTYTCGHCGFTGPCFGAITSHGGTAPWCPQCGKNDKLVLGGK